MSLTLGSCDSKRTEYAFFDDERKKVESIIEYKDGKIDGKVIKYYPNHMLKEISHWKNGQLDGEMYGFRPDSSIAVKHFYAKGKILQYEAYYQSGILKEVIKRDDSGSVIDVKRYDETGELLEMEPVVFVNSDLIKLGDTLKIRIRMDNMNDLSYLNGTLIVGSGFLSSPSDYGLSDTIAIINSKTNQYRLEFIPKKPGLDTICFQLRYIIRDTVEVMTFFRFFDIKDSN